MRRQSIMLAALAGLGSLSAPASAQDAAAESRANSLCSFHGPGCDASPAEWQWQRLAPTVGVYSVELPCDGRQADAFSQVLAISRAQFPAGSTRACMKAAAGFTSTMVGLTALPEGGTPPEVDRLLNGAPDLFSRFLQQTNGTGSVEASFKGRRAVSNIIEREGRRTKVMLVEAGQYAVIMLTADVLSDFPGTREDADAAVERFFESLEFAE